MWLAPALQSRDHRGFISRGWRQRRCGFTPAQSVKKVCQGEGGKRFAVLLDMRRQLKGNYAENNLKVYVCNAGAPSLIKLKLQCCWLYSLHTKELLCCCVLYTIFYLFFTFLCVSLCPGGEIRKVWIFIFFFYEFFFFTCSHLFF